MRYVSLAVDVATTPPNTSPFAWFVSALAQTNHTTQNHQILNRVNEYSLQQHCVAKAMYRHRANHAVATCLPIRPTTTPNQHVDRSKIEQTKERSYESRHSATQRDRFEIDDRVACRWCKQCWMSWRRFVIHKLRRRHHSPQSKFLTCRNWSIKQTNSKTRFLSFFLVLLLLVCGTVTNNLPKN